ncbi:hypothetical protein OUZ56_004922 [Daphnia magna]|uniref:Uncharacterized protein n=1 Tax=Daphnia magna TaxID=35525 RepID=A0ABQ9YRB7_9CRUS|nr:hypothetical protein OUZ56_004922 [Daphnia magna]
MYQTKRAHNQDNEGGKKKNSCRRADNRKKTAEMKGADTNKFKWSKKKKMGIGQGGKNSSYDHHHFRSSSVHTKTAATFLSFIHFSRPSKSMMIIPRDLLRRVTN